MSILSSFKDVIAPVKNRVHNFLNRVRGRKKKPSRSPALTPQATVLTVRNLRGPGDVQKLKLNQDLLQLDLFNGQLNSSALKEGREEIDRVALWNPGLSEADFEEVSNTDKNPAPQKTSIPQARAQRIREVMESAPGREDVLNTLGIILREQGINIFDQEIFQVAPRVASHLIINVFEISRRLENNSACRDLIRNLLLLPSQFREAAIQRLRARVRQIEQTEWQDIPGELRQEGIGRATKLWQSLPVEIQERITTFNDHPNMTPSEFILQNFYELERAVSPDALPPDFAAQLSRIWIDIRARSILPPARPEKHVTPHTFIQPGETFVCGKNRYQLIIDEESGLYYIQRGIIVNADAQNRFIADPSTRILVNLPAEGEHFGIFNVPGENSLLNIARNENGSFTFSVIDKAYVDGANRKGKVA